MDRDRFARYDDAIGSLVHDGAVAGYVFVQVSGWSVAEGPRRGRRERWDGALDWTAVFLAGDPRTDEGSYRTPAEGADLDRDVLVSRGVRHRVEWVDDDARSFAIWREHFAPVPLEAPVDPAGPVATDDDRAPGRGIIARMTVPRAISEGIAASVQRTVPDRYAIRVVGSGRSLLVDGPSGTLLGGCFVHPLVPVLRWRFVPTLAVVVLEVVEDAVTGHEGGVGWLDPRGEATARIEGRARLRGRTLHLAYTSGTAVVRRLEPITLPARWRQVRHGSAGGEANRT